MQLFQAQFLIKKGERISRIHAINLAMQCFFSAKHNWEDYQKPSEEESNGK
jgi:hypothetical protein